MELIEDYIELIFGADAVVGAGKVVDAYYGHYKPENIYSGVTIKKLTELFEDFEVRLKKEILAKPKDLDLVDAEEATRAIRLFLSYQSEINDYKKQVSTMYGQSLKVVSKKNIETIRKHLNGLLSDLGYTDKWPENIKRWHSDSSVSAEEYLRVMKERTRELRDETFKRLLPKFLDKDVVRSLEEKSKVQIKLVDTSESWGAYHYYEGKYRSLVELNSSGKFNKHDAQVFASHEIFPGHHTESIIKEALYSQGKISLPATLTILNGPGCILSEGIGDYGFFFFNHKKSKDTEVAYLEDILNTSVRHNCAVKVLSNEWPKDRAAEIMGKDLGIHPENAQRRLEFAYSWKYYFPVYVMGYQLVEKLFNKYHENILFPLYTRSSPKSLKKYINL